MKQTTSDWYEWFFTEEERAPMGFIPTFFTIILVSIGISILIVGMS